MRQSRSHAGMRPINRLKNARKNASTLPRLFYLFARLIASHIHLVSPLSSKGKNLYSHPISDFSVISQTLFLGSVWVLSQNPLFSRSYVQKRPYAEEFSSTQGHLVFLDILFLRLSLFAFGDIGVCL